MARPGLIVDRDGTLVEERGYICDPVDLVPLAGAIEALAAARAMHVAVAVVTNQSAVGRGIVTEERLRELHEIVRRMGVDAVYHCPHLPDDSCACRKPQPGMVHLAIEELDLDPRRTAFVGDHLTDCLAARAAGIEGVLVRTGHGRTYEDDAIARGFVVVDDVGAAVDWFRMWLAHVPS